MKKRLSVVVGLISTILICGCDSKNIEKDPDHINITGLTLEERIANKVQIDDAIEKLDNGSRKIKRILDLVKKLNKNGVFHRISSNLPHINANWAFCF